MRTTTKERTIRITLEMFTKAEKEQSEIEVTVREDLISEKLLMTTGKAVLGRER